MKVADRLAALVRDVTGTEPPIRIRAWDGSEAGPADAPVLIIRIAAGTASIALGAR